ncbi:MAG TPA: TraB/GumN family protein, partial [Burkholderiaceae bacterium]
MRLLRTSLLAAALALAAGCARAEPPRPLLWKVSDGDNAVYLLGSFHALRPGDYPLAPAVDAAFDDAEQVAFELSPAELESPELPRKMLAAAQLPAGQTLEGVLSARRWKQLQAYAHKRGLPLANFTRVEPWFLSLVISVTEMQQLGLDPQQGLDRQLVARAQAANKPTLGLETGDEQIAALDSMSLEEQRQALAESLDEAGDYRRELEKLHDRWRAGDA